MKYTNLLPLWLSSIYSTTALSFNPNVSVNPNQITESFIATDYRRRLDQERYLNDEYMDRRSRRDPYGRSFPQRNRRDIIDEEYVRSLEERLEAFDARNQRRGPQMNREPAIDAGYVNTLEARLRDLERKQGAFRQDPRRSRSLDDDRSRRDVDSQASYAERRQEIARGRVPVDQRINNEERRPNENGRRLANPARHRRFDDEGYSPVNPDKFTDFNGRDGYDRRVNNGYNQDNRRLDDLDGRQRRSDYPRDNVDRRLEELERQRNRDIPRNIPRDNRLDEIDRQRDYPRESIPRNVDEFDRQREPRPETKYEENINVRLDGLENMQRPERNTLAMPTNPNSYTQNSESRLALTDKKQEVITYDDFSVANRPSLSQQIFDRKGPTKIQGGALKTFVTSPNVNAVHVVMRSEGRPIDADLELWHGPDNTPYKMRVYIENGSERHFSAMIGTPRGPNTVAIRNTGHLEFPLDSCVVADTVDIIGGSPIPEESETKYEPKIIQGGALHTYNFDHNIEAVQILIKTDGRPLNARIELLKGPNDLKQTVEVYSEDGVDRPFFIVVETPGNGNTVRVVNTSELEFPMYSWVEPYSIRHSNYNNDNRMVNYNGNDRLNVPGRHWDRRR